jgi:hypothetical protein
MEMKKRKNLLRTGMRYLHSMTCPQENAAASQKFVVFFVLRTGLGRFLLHDF